MEDYLANLEKIYSGVGKENFTFDKEDILNWLKFPGNSKQRESYFNSTFAQLVNNETNLEDYNLILIENHINKVDRQELLEMYDDYLSKNSQINELVRLDLEFAKIPATLSLIVVIINQLDLDPSIKSIFTFENLAPIILFYSTEIAANISANYQNINIEQNRQNRLQKVFPKD